MTSTPQCSLRARPDSVDDQTHTVHSGAHLRVRPAEPPVGDLGLLRRASGDGTGA